MSMRSIEEYAELGRQLTENNRRDDLSITETAKLMQTAGAGDSDRLLKAIATAFYMGYAAGYKRKDSSRIITPGKYPKGQQAKTAAENS